MRERIRKWLFPTLEAEIDALRARIAMLDLAISGISKQEPVKTAAEMMRPLRPFNVNRVPGRKLRAEQEWKHSPEYKQDIAKKQEVKALQPKG